MIYLDWVELNSAETAGWREQVNGEASFQLPENVRMRAATLPFYDEYKFYGMADTSKPEPNERYMLAKAGDLNLMDWTNEPIYRTNEKAPIKIDRKNVIPYAKFFFHYVRGQLGRFIIVEKPEEVRWLPAATAEEKEKVNALITPVTYKGLNRYNQFTLSAIVVFKNALFRTNILVAPMEMDVPDEETGEMEHMTIGQMKLVGEELLLEDLQMPIDGPPTEFG